MSLGDWAKSASKGKTHVVSEHKDGVTRVVSVHPTKKEARAEGTRLRKAGRNVNVFSSKDYKKFVDSKWDESAHPRNDHGQFE